jgi:hypothetical protein
MHPKGSVSLFGGWGVVGFLLIVFVPDEFPNMFCRIPIPHMFLKFSMSSATCSQ